MNRFYTLLCLLFFTLATASVSGQVRYVKTDATGANDGTSWENAYTSLDDALADAAAAEIWVAAGTYKPGGAMPDTLSRFTIDRGVSVYGGFAGAETALEERDVANNLTILDGDLAGDDVFGDFDNNKEDNVLHVVYVDSLILDPIRIDGFVIKSGHNNFFLDGVSEYFWRGGGVFAYSTLTIANCSFTQNFANNGGAIYVGAYSPNVGAVIEDCLITDNFASSAAVYLSGLTGAIIERTDFTDNNSVRGALYPINCIDLTINDCLFQNNVNPTSFGGAFFSWQCLDVSITNTDFINNTAASSGAMYIDGRDIPSFDVETFVIDNCTFDGNTATNGFGGAINNNRQSIRISNSDFSNNTCTQDGGAVLFGGAGKNALVENCTFEGNSATFGGAVRVSSGASLLTVRNSIFSENVAATSGGAIINAFQPILNIDSCIFENNTARFAAGVYSQNDTTETTVTNTIFLGNAAESLGGATIKSSGTIQVMDNCHFEGNSSGGSGGAIWASDNSATENLGLLTVRNSVFDFNFAETQGGAADLSSCPSEFISSLFSNNSALSGFGGGIINNVSDSTEVSMLLLNNTFANNLSSGGNNLAQWSGGDFGIANTDLQNNIFFSDLGGNYGIEDGNPALNSLGGNLSNDNSMNDYLTADKDVTNVDPLFVDVNNGDYHLGFGSPAINGGIADGAPEFDIEGNPRIGDPDKGAFEYDPETSTEEVIVNLGQLRVFPNPAGAQTLLKLNNNWRGELFVNLFDNQGRLLQTLHVEKATDRFEQALNLSGLNAGMYRLTVSNGEQMLTLPLVRQ